VLTNRVGSESEEISSEITKVISYHTYIKWLSNRQQILTFESQSSTIERQARANKSNYSFKSLDVDTRV
jgi:hypothetical protein